MSLALSGLPRGNPNSSKLNYFSHHSLVTSSPPKPIAEHREEPLHSTQMANSGTSSNNSTPSTPSSHNPPTTPFAQHPSSQFIPYLYHNQSQFQPQFQSQTPPPFTMLKGDPSYGQYQNPFTLSQPQPQAFNPYYQPYPLTQPQGF
ncbi:hypothetical protein GIB67_018334 [Kingdonia uniflora]|uniref:Uncharacterized protein n=1 Tax=Kingdonia uniflora TaxID=39325 RepID=A0A7J7MJ60_9MAGN|nr:hypothetical protein GIB67_018334 [Kingdonia uniflora]